MKNALYLGILFCLALFVSCVEEQDDPLLRGNALRNLNLKGSPSLLVEVGQEVRFDGSLIVVKLSNVSNDSIGPFELLLEFYDSESRNYNDLIYAYRYGTTVAIQAHESVYDTLDYYVKIIVDEKFIESAVLSSDGIYSGYYSGKVQLRSTGDTSRLEIHETRGIIDVEGRVRFKVNGNESVKRIEGFFLDSLTFSGQIINKDAAAISGLTIPANYFSADSPNVTFRFNASTSFDSVDSLILNIKPN